MKSKNNFRDVHAEYIERSSQRAVSFMHVARGQIKYLTTDMEGVGRWFIGT